MTNALQSTPAVKLDEALRGTKLQLGKPIELSTVVSDVAETLAGVTNNILAGNSSVYTTDTSKEAITQNYIHYIEGGITSCYA